MAAQNLCFIFFLSSYLNPCINFKGRGNDLIISSFSINKSGVKILKILLSSLQ